MRGAFKAMVAEEGEDDERCEKEEIRDRREEDGAIETEGEGSGGEGELQREVQEIRRVADVAEKGYTLKSPFKQVLRAARTPPEKLWLPTLQYD